MGKEVLGQEHGIRGVWEREACTSVNLFFEPCTYAQQEVRQNEVSLKLAGC